jgi:hypothetical protein
VLACISVHANVSSERTSAAQHQRSVVIFPVGSRPQSRQTYLRVQTKLLQSRELPRGADFVVKVLVEVSEHRRSDHASNIIPRSAATWNAVPRITPIGTRILSVDGTLGLAQVLTDFCNKICQKPSLKGSVAANLGQLRQREAKLSRKLTLSSAKGVSGWPGRNGALPCRRDSELQ